jgi:hypothetical protein
MDTALCKVLAKEVAPFNVRVLTVGGIQYEVWEWVFGSW